MPVILRDVEIILGAALAVVLLFRRLRLPTVAGFLLAGILIGPSGLRLIGDPGDVREVAEVGVVLLLFTIGIDLSLGHLVRRWHALVVAGAAQVALTTAAAAGTLRLLGGGWGEAALVGFLLSLSSTAIVLKSLAARGEVGTPHGQLAVGVLLFQDMAVIPAMAVLPWLGAAGHGGAGVVGVALAKAAAGVTAVLAAGRYLAPRLFASAVKTRSREVFTMLVVVILLGAAWLTERLGLSLALGAFLAGLVLSESEYGTQALAEVFPVKETFSGIFFTSIGMLLDLRFALAHLGAILALAALVVIGKAALGTLACRAAHPSWRVSLAAGLSLAQIGEFALVLAGAALALGLLPAQRQQVLLAATVLTMLVSPFLVSSAHRAALRLTERAAGAAAAEVPRADRERCALSGHVVIVGYGLNGANLARVLAATGIPYLALDMNPALVEAGRRSGHDVRYGDGTLREVLDAAGVPCARVVVVAISDPLATRQVVTAARLLNPGVHVVVRTRFLREIEELHRLGASDVVAEEFETSVEIFTRVLRELLVPRNVIAIQVDLVRREGYGMLRGLRMPSRLADQLTHLLAASAVDNVQLLAGAPAIGRSIAEVRLRKRCGATIVAVVRDGKAHTNPPPDWVFAEGDILVVIGAHREVDEAERILTAPAAGGVDEAGQAPSPAGP